MIRLRDELTRTVPAFIFFYLAFNLINYTQVLMFHDQFEPYPQIVVLFGSVIVPKILILIDHLPLTSCLRKKPLFYDIIWKATFYSVIIFFARIALRNEIPDETLLPPFTWSRFWAIQIWYTVLFFVYVSARELTYELGPRTMHKLFFKNRS